MSTILAAAKARGDRTIRWKDSSLPFTPTDISKSSDIIRIDKPAPPRLINKATKKMWDISGFFPALLTHDIRRGCAKDLAKLPEDIMKASHEGPARAMGHYSIRNNKVYNSDEDEAIRTQKTKLPLTSVDTGIPQANSLYIPLPRRALMNATDKYIRTHADELFKGSSLSVTDLTGKCPEKSHPDHKEWNSIRRKA